MKNPLFSLAALAAVSLCVLAPTVVLAQVPQPLAAYISSIKGQKTGVIKGDALQNGRTGWFQLYSYRQEIASPRDAASGLPTGRRQHKPIVITRKAGMGSSQLMNALVNNEILTEVKFSFWQSRGGGVEENFQNVTLTNVSLAGFRQFDLAGVGLMEELTFTYQRIELTTVLGGITTQDNWESR